MGLLFTQPTVDGVISENGVLALPIVGMESKNDREILKLQPRMVELNVQDRKTKHKSAKSRNVQV